MPFCISWIVRRDDFAEFTQYQIFLSRDRILNYRRALWGRVRHGPALPGTEVSLPYSPSLPHAAARVRPVWHLPCPPRTKTYWKTVRLPNHKRQVQEADIYDCEMTCNADNFIVIMENTQVHKDWKSAEMPLKKQKQAECSQYYYWKACFKQ